MPQQREIQVSDAQWLAARAMLADGAGTDRVATRLDRSEDTVKSHLKAVYRKAGVQSRTELAVAVWSGQIDLVSPRHGSVIVALEERLALA